MKRNTEANMANFFLTKLQSMQWKKSSPFNKWYQINQISIWGKNETLLNFANETKVKIVHKPKRKT